MAAQDVTLYDSRAFATAKPSQMIQVDPNDQLSDGIGASYGVVGYKGKVWSLRYRGERHTFVRPDDGTPTNYIDVVILRQARHKSKSFYAKYDPTSSDGERPICSSMNGVVPDIDVQQQQAVTCALCPRNAWKVDPTGRKGRECTDYKRLAVLVLPTMTSVATGGNPVMEPVFLRVPPASLNNLALLGEQMTKQGWAYPQYVTRISFDPQEAHPKMIFRAVQGLTDAEAPVIEALRQSPICDRIVSGDFDGGTSGTLQPLAPAGAAPTGITAPTAAQPAAQPAPQQAVQQEPVMTIIPPQQPAQPPAAGTGSPPPLINITGLAPDRTGPAPDTVQARVATPQEGAQVGQQQNGVLTTAFPTQQTAADIGEPEESDADLDQRIGAALSGLIKS